MLSIKPLLKPARLRPGLRASASLPGIDKPPQSHWESSKGAVERSPRPRVTPPTANGSPRVPRPAQRYEYAAERVTGATDAANLSVTQAAVLRCEHLLGPVHEGAFADALQNPKKVPWQEPGSASRPHTRQLSPYGMRPSRDVLY